MKEIIYSPGYQGDHDLIDIAIRHGHKLTSKEMKYHNWEGGYTESYDIALDRAASRAIQFLIEQGFTITKSKD
jgi:hypothetical protein